MIFSGSVGGSRKVDREVSSGLGPRESDKGDERGEGRTEKFVLLLV